MVALTVNLIGLPENRWAVMNRVPSSLTPRTPFCSRVLAPLPLPLPLLRLLRRLAARYKYGALLAQATRGSFAINFLTLVIEFPAFSLVRT